MDKEKKSFISKYPVSISITAICVPTIIYLSLTIDTLHQERAIKETYLEETNQQLEDTLSLLKLTELDRKNLSVLLEQKESELSITTEKYLDEKIRNDQHQEDYGEMIETIRDLDKLAKIDEEILQKYSKIYFLNENYVPRGLKDINPDLMYEKEDLQYFHGKALPFLEEMLAEAKESGQDIKILSAYRSFGEQAHIKSSYVSTYGEGANAFSADQGYSEHQLGTAVDLTNQEVGGAELTFKDSKEYEWLIDNAHKYGFILSYPEDNVHYIFEPWHWRFVGVKLAKYLNRRDISFYDLDQNKINSYLLTIFD